MNTVELETAAPATRRVTREVKPVELAREVLTTAAAKAEFPVSLPGIFRSRGVVVADRDLADGPDALLIETRDGFSALILNTNNPEPIRRWVAAEYLYIALARPEVPKRKYDDSTYYDLEALPEANDFAVALLLPAADVAHVWRREIKSNPLPRAVRVVAGVFDVSEAAARARLAELGLITGR